MPEQQEQARNRIEVLRTFLTGSVGMFATMIDRPDMGELRMIGNQMARGVIAFIAGFGGAKDPAFKQVYHDNSLSPLQKLFRLGPMMLEGGLNDANFHAQYGSLIDTELSRMYVKLADYFGKSMERVNESPGQLDPNLP